MHFKQNDVVNNVRLSILKDIDNICEKNNLKYFAISHLLVGAVHYNDFIDNGLDSDSKIALLRDDFEKLKNLLSDNAQSLGLEIIDRYTSGAKSLEFYVAKSFTVEQENLSVEDKAVVELCAFDYVPDNEAVRKLFIEKAHALFVKYKKIVNLLPPKTDVPMNLRKVVFFFLDSLFYSTRSGSKTYNKLFETISKYKNTQFVADLSNDKGVVMKVDDLFPLKRVKFNDIELNIPKTFNKWTVKIDEKLMAQTKAIQKLDLVLLKEFDTVCRKIGVNYFICGGTMLGFMRHGGFIPWDDDIDVGMLRADYDKFIKEANKHLGEDFFLQTRKSDKKIPYLFSKIRLNGTSYVTQYNEKRDFHKGICLDLFPFDYVPNSLSERHRFVQKALFWSNVHFETVNRQIEKIRYDKRSESIAEWFSRTKSELKRKLIKLVPLTLTERLYLKKATKLNKKAKELKLTTVASFLPDYTYIDIDDIMPYQDIDFEGVRVMALKNMDKFLTMQYGDYHKLPLLHNRVGHDLLSWSVDDDIARKYHIYD